MQLRLSAVGFAVNCLLSTIRITRISIARFKYKYIYIRGKLINTQ